MDRDHLFLLLMWVVTLMALVGSIMLFRDLKNVSRKSDGTAAPLSTAPAPWFPAPRMEAVRTKDGFVLPPPPN